MIQNRNPILFILSLLVLSSAVPQLKLGLPAGIALQDVLLYSLSDDAKVMAIVIGTQISIYNQDDHQQYAFVGNQSICQASSIAISQGKATTHTHVRASNYGYRYNVVVGCFNGQLHVYQISRKAQEYENKHKAIKQQYSIKLQAPITKLIQIAPYLLIQCQKSISGLNMNDNTMQQFAFSGHISQFYKHNDDTVHVSSQNYQMFITVTPSNQLSVRTIRKSMMMGMIVPSKGRLFQVINTNVSTCGDDNTNLAFQQCDDGNTISGDGCSFDCKVQYCGDGIVNNNGQQCDPGNATILTTCRADCKLYCGDGNLDKNQPQLEFCDDGNRINGDGCSENCQPQSSQSFGVALGTGLGVGMVGVIGIIISTAATPTTTGASQLVGIGPMIAFINQGSSNLNATVSPNMPQIPIQANTLGIQSKSINQKIDMENPL